MITGMQLKRISPQVFTYSAQYQAPFYGRKVSIQETQNKTAALQPGQCLLISQPLGTGKTFLVNHMIANGKLDVPRGATFLTTRGIAERPESMEEFPGAVLVVDETDIKTTYRKLEAGLGQLQDFLDRTGKRAVVLGDFCLRNQALKSILREPEQVLNFEPIDEVFLRGTLEQRFHHFLGDLLEEDFSLDQVMAPDLLRAFTPEWILSVNNFRGIFSLLQAVVGDDRLVKFNSTAVRLELSMVMEHLQREAVELDTEEQEEYLEVLRSYLRANYPMGKGLVRGFQMDELYQLAENAGIDVEYDDFAEDILYPLAVEGLLISNGIPVFQNGTFVRRPLPLVPSLKLLLSAQ